MSTETVQLFAALLTIVSWVGIAGLIAVRVLRGRSVLAAEVNAVVAEQRSLIVAIVTGTATAGSLYFSEVANYIPCTLCWYQRIAMYSLAAISITAAIRHETPVAYFVVLAGLGAPISLYHWLLERFPDLETGVCSTAIPCDVVWFERFGVITLPAMAFTAFCLVLAVSLLPRQEHP